MDARCSSEQLPIVNAVAGCNLYAGGKLSGCGDDRLPGRKAIYEGVRPDTVELREDVVEEEYRRGSDPVRDQVMAGNAHRQGERSLLALGRVCTRG